MSRTRQAQDRRRARYRDLRKLTTLVNVAAAVTPDGTVETLSLAQWNQAIGVNLTGAFLMCNTPFPSCARRRRQHH